MNMYLPFNSRMAARMIQYVKLPDKQKFIDLCETMPNPYAILNNQQYYELTKQYCKEQSTSFKELVTSLLDYARTLQ